MHDGKFPSQWNTFILHSQYRSSSVQLRHQGTSSPAIGAPFLIERIHYRTNVLSFWLSVCKQVRLQVATPLLLV